jgi:hypothetical protein
MFLILGINLDSVLGYPSFQLIKWSLLPVSISMKVGRVQKTTTSSKKRHSIKTAARADVYLLLASSSRERKIGVPLKNWKVRAIPPRLIDRFPCRRLIRRLIRRDRVRRLHFRLPCYTLRAYCVRASLINDESVGLRAKSAATRCFSTLQYR